MRIIRDDFKYIVDKNFLLNAKHEKFDDFIDEEEQFSHPVDSNKWVYNAKYIDLMFNHDFFVDNNKILNYKFIETKQQEKKDNFIDIIKSTDTKLFIHFTQSKININDYNDFLSLLEEKYKCNMMQIYILIFTNNNDDYCQNNIQIIK